MEPIIDQLSKYRLEIGSLSKSLQKEEKSIKDYQTKFSSQRHNLTEEMSQIIKVEYELANEFLKVLEEHDFLKTDSPELERAIIKKDYLDYKECQYNAQDNFVSHKEKFLYNNIANLPKEKQLMYEKISQKLKMPNDPMLYMNENIDHSIQLSTEDMDAIDDIAIAYERRVRTVNEITAQRTPFTPRPSSIPRKKRIRFLSSDDSKLNLIDYDKLLPVSSSVKTIDGVVNPNKSFYLLWNLRLRQSVSNLSEIGHDEIGGSKCCSHLLKTYHNNIVYTEKVRSNSGSSFKRNKYRHYSERSTRRHNREASSNDYIIPRKIIENEPMDNRAPLSIRTVLTEN